MTGEDIEIERKICRETSIGEDIEIERKICRETLIGEGHRDRKKDM